ncbi:MAG: glycosyltransferase [Microbacteriaceae bacterium]
MPRRVSVLVLGTADWQQPIATNQHYVTRELAADSDFALTFVESLALRRPQFTSRDVHRMLGRIRRAFSRAQETRSTRPIPDGMTIISPLVIPLHSGLAARINRRLLARRVTQWAQATGLKLLWTYTPVTYGLEEVADATMYHCVDLLGKFAGVDERVIARGERNLARHGAAAAATSEVVRTHLEEVGFVDVALWENVADIDVITVARPELTPRIPRRVIFAGNLSPKKVDFGLLEALADEGLEVLVAGPRAEGGGGDDTEYQSMIRHGVHHLGMLSLEELAGELAQASVGLIPYRINDYTRGVSPLKTYEYLAAGLPVVSTALPGVHASEGDVWVEHDPVDFVRVAKELAQSFDPASLERRVASAAAHSWTGRGAEARALAHELLLAR